MLARPSTRNMDIVSWPSVAAFPAVADIDDGNGNDDDGVMKHQRPESILRFRLLSSQIENFRVCFEKTNRSHEIVWRVASDDYGSRTNDVTYRKRNMNSVLVSVLVVYGYVVEVESGGKGCFGNVICGRFCRFSKRNLLYFGKDMKFFRFNMMPEQVECLSTKCVWAEDWAHDKSMTLWADTFPLEADDIFSFSLANEWKCVWKSCHRAFLPHENSPANCAPIQGALDCYFIQASNWNEAELCFALLLLLFGSFCVLSFFVCFDLWSLNIFHFTHWTRMKEPSLDFLRDIKGTYIFSFRYCSILAEIMQSDIVEEQETENEGKTNTRNVLKWKTTKLLLLAIVYSLDSISSCVGELQHQFLCPKWTEDGKNVPSSSSSSIHSFPLYYMQNFKSSLLHV